jgi:hypothetical protein
VAVLRIFLRGHRKKFSTFTLAVFNSASISKCINIFQVIGNTAIPGKDFQNDIYLVKIGKDTGKRLFYLEINNLIMFVNRNVLQKCLYLQKTGCLLSINRRKANQFVE